MRRGVTAKVVLAIAGVLLAGLPAVAEGPPVEVAWRNTMKHPADSQRLLVDPASGDVVAVTAPTNDAVQVVRRLDGRTGKVQWTAEVPGWMTDLEVHPTSGRVVLAGKEAAGVRVVVLDAGGAVVWQRLTSEETLVGLAVDPVSGRVCTVGRSGRRRAGSETWFTSCWTMDGALVFADAWAPPEGPSQANDIAIDPRTHRIYVVGTSRPVERLTEKGQDVVLLAYEPEGRMAWTARSAGAVRVSFYDIGLDPARHRVYLLGEPYYSNYPMRLFAYSASGRKVFVKRWRDEDHVDESALAITTSGGVLAVSANNHHATMRSYSVTGRLLSSGRVPIADRDAWGGLPDVAIDQRRQRVYVVNDESGVDHTTSLYVFAFNRRLLSRSVVDRAKPVPPQYPSVDSSIVFDAASGRVLVASTLSEDPGRHRITAFTS